MQDGGLGATEFVPRLPARLISVDGAPPAGRFRVTTTVLWEADQPPTIRVMEGSWWSRNPSEPVVSVGTETAKQANVHVGWTIEMQSSGRTIRARVVAVHQWKAQRFMPTSSWVFNPQALEGLPVAYDGGVRMRPSAGGALQRAAFEKVPTATVVNIAHALEIVQQVGDQIALGIRFLSGLPILSRAAIQ